MAFKKIGKFAKKQWKNRNTWVKAGQTALPLARQAWSLAKHIKTLINVERKFVTSGSPTTAVSSTGNVILLSGIAQGDTQNQRNGNRVKANALHISGYFEVNASATARTAVRVLIFKDKTSDGVIPTILELLYTSDPQAIYNPNNCPYRFQILYDRKFMLSPVTYGNGINNYHMNFFTKLNHHLTYEGVTANIGDVMTGNIFMLILSDQATNEPNLNYYSKFTYIDN